MEILKKYLSMSENQETLITIIIYNKKISEIINFFENELAKAQKISNPMKKHKINNRLYNFINIISAELELEKTVNSIFLLSESMIEYKLKENEIKTAVEYNFPKIFVKMDNQFCIDYILDFFYNFDFIYSIKINNNESYLSKSNKNKEKLIDSSKNTNESKIGEYIEFIRKNELYKELIILHGKSVFLSKLNNNNIKKSIIIHDKFLSKEEIYLYYENDFYLKNMEELEKRLNDLNNCNTNLDLYIFGKLKVEIKEAIEQYLIKELYIEAHKLEKLKLCIEHECFNFKIILIKSLVNDDVADNFIKNYNGLMGIKYY